MTSISVTGTKQEILTKRSRTKEREESDALPRTIRIRLRISSKVSNSAQFEKLRKSRRIKRIFKIIDRPPRAAILKAVLIILKAHLTERSLSEIHLITTNIKREESAARKRLDKTIWLSMRTKPCRILLIVIHWTISRAKAVAAAFFKQQQTKAMPAAPKTRTHENLPPVESRTS